jgi:hypothetical protein
VALGAAVVAAMGLTGAVWAADRDTDAGARAPAARDGEGDVTVPGSGEDAGAPADRGSWEEVPPAPQVGPGGAVPDGGSGAS